MREAETDGLVLQMIGGAVMAGAYRTLAAELPEASKGLLKMAAKHSARVAALADEICAGSGVMRRGPARASRER